MGRKLLIGKGKESNRTDEKNYKTSRDPRAKELKLQELTNFKKLAKLCTVFLKIGVFRKKLESAVLREVMELEG
jgi:hypothetical protein